MLAMVGAGAVERRLLWSDRARVEVVWVRLGQEIGTWRENPLCSRFTSLCIQSTSLPSFSSVESRLVFTCTVRADQAITCSLGNSINLQELSKAPNHDEREVYFTVR